MTISEDSRIWIYQSSRVFNEAEVTHIQQKLNDFTSQWLAHGNKLAALGEVRFNQFIILSVDEMQAGATGCSIDKSVKLIQEIEQELSVNLFDRFRVAYREGDNIISCDRQEFEDFIKTGKVTEQTIVFNNLISTRKELETNWQIEMKSSWHSQVFM
jgi:hypothetical protein